MSWEVWTMKSRISFCDKTVLRKDILRFAPLWGIYFVGGLLVMLTLSLEENAHTLAQALGICIGIFSIINMIYAALVAQMLFGDLYNSRLCNALHAMPPRREHWFFTHLTAGLLFSLVPNLVGILVTLPTLGEFWYIAFIWLLGMTLHYLFFFGLAVFSCMCAGNRIAMTAVYSILNFASMIAYWFITTIYEPLLHGISFQIKPFARFCPVVNIPGGEFLRIERVALDRTIVNTRYEYVFEGLTSDWNYLVIVALVGIALMGLSLLLYRRRKLECAGDFMAVKAMEPIFAVVFSLCVGCVFAFIGDAFEQLVTFLVVGLLIGWFAGQMLLRRTVKVFQWKTFLKLALLGLVLGATLVLTQWDPLGITRWVPESQQVVKVELDMSTTIRPTSSNYLEITSQEQIEKFIDIHEQLAADRTEQKNSAYRPLILRYQLADGRQVTRTYKVYKKTNTWDALQALYNTPQRILGCESLEDFLKELKLLRYNGYSIQEMCNRYASKTEKVIDSHKIQNELAEAIWKDCEAGNLPQSFERGNYEGYLEIDFVSWSENRNTINGVNYYTESVNIMTWMAKYKHILKYAE